MKSSVEQFNALNGREVSRSKIEEILRLARVQKETAIVFRLARILNENPEEEKFLIKVKEYPALNAPAVVDDVVFENGNLQPGYYFESGQIMQNTVEEFASLGIPELTEPIENDFVGLGKAVSPNEIYQYITDLILNTIETKGHLPWQKLWKKTAFGSGYPATNFITKSQYRGINSFLLNFDVKVEEGKAILVQRIWNNPYFMTFKQIQDKKGQLRKGAKGHFVVYFTKLYSHEETHPDGTKLEFSSYDKSKFLAWIIQNQNKLLILKRSGWTVERLSNVFIPILKYYKIFNCEDVTGINFGELPKNPNIDKPEAEKIEICEAVLENIPNPPKIFYRGNQPAYYPTLDHIEMTPIEQFINPQSFYCVLFHELTHSTGHSKRLDRGNDTRKRDGSAEDKKAYDFEELVAEMGAVFLSAETGILFQTRDQSAKYLKYYMNKLTMRMKEDNRFFFRAASAAQAASDYILDRNDEGIPAYIKTTKVTKTANKVAKKTAVNKEVAKKTTKKAANEPANEPAKNVKKAKQKLVSLIEKGMPGIDAIIKVGNELENEQKAKKRPGKAKKAPTKKTEKPTNTVKKVVFNGQKKAKNIDLDKTNPKPFANKPKSVSVQTAIKDVLSLSKFKGVSPLIASIIYKKFDVNDITVETVKFSDYENGILKKDSVFHVNFGDEIELLSLGKDFINAVNGRLESLRNQKNNFALFDGLKKPRKKVKALNQPAPQPDINIIPAEILPQAQPVQSNGNTLADRLKNRNRARQYYKIANSEIAKFLGNIEIKEKESVAITLTGGQGSMKTRFCFQLMNALAQNYKVGHASIEEHPESGLYFDKVEQYLNGKAIHNITAPEINSIADVHKLVQENDVIVIDSFSKLQELDKNCELDKDFRKKYNGKLFIIIYQTTTDGKMRGGSKSQFDGDIILFIEKFPNYKENYVYPDKNRYQNQQLDQLKYNIFSQKMQPVESDQPELISETIEPVAPIEFSFNVK